MSYVTMDHAGWVESNIRPGRAMARKPARNSDGVIIGWHAAPDKLNRFQARVMDICGMVFGGIYNAPISWEAVYWRDEHVGVPLRRGRCSMATHDFALLTRLVFLCMEARIRVELSPRGMNALSIDFWQRSHDGGMAERHPDIGEAVAEFQAYLPPDHSVRYRPEMDDPLPGRRRRSLEYLATSGAAKLADEVIAAIAEGNERDAKWKSEQLDRNLAIAGEYAAKLGGGPEVMELAAQVAAQHERVAAARAAAPTHSEAAA